MSILKKILGFLWRFTKWFLKPKRLIVSITITILAIAGISFYSYKVEQGIIKDAVQACKNLHDKEINSFSDITGLVAENVDYGTPDVEIAPNVRVLDFKDIKVGNSLQQYSKYICVYNLATKKAKDQTPPPEPPKA